MVLCACSSAGFCHCCLFVVTAVRCLFVFQSASIVYDYTAHYRLGTALSVVRVRMRTQRRNCSVFSSIHLNMTWEVLVFFQMKCINVIDIKLEEKRREQESSYLNLSMKHTVFLNTFFASLCSQVAVEPWTWNRSFKLFHGPFPDNFASLSWCPLLIKQKLPQSFTSCPKCDPASFNLQIKRCWMLDCSLVSFESLRQKTLDHVSVLEVWYLKMECHF